MWATLLTVISQVLSLVKILTDKSSAYKKQFEAMLKRENQRAEDEEKARKAYEEARKTKIET